ncbi:MAG: hypothetical protein MUF40_02560 [Gemmatimonadaceae bacterium]|nr:hypothetical protein [Gemmatimonadaceae bacterium]
MSEITSTLETVSTLLGERARYEGWLRALEDKRATMPAHVVERVRHDYGDRLLGVLTSIATHAPALDEAARALAARDATLLRDEDARHDARAEAELRHAVGEYDDATWERLRAEHDGVLGTLAEERRGLATELATVRGLLAQAQDAQAVVEAGGPLAVMAAAAPAVAPTREPAPLAEALATADAAADALAGTEAGPGAAPSRGDDLAFTGTPDEGTAAAAEPASLSDHAPPLAPAAAAAEATGAPRPSDGRKTLKCGECATMNLPSEWYCEQCGGELAVF